MALPRGSSGSFVHSINVVLATPFIASDAILVLTGAADTITLKSGSTIAMTTVTGQILPFSAINITGTGVYVALYK